MLAENRWQGIERWLLAFTFDSMTAQHDSAIYDLCQKLPQSNTGFLSHQYQGYLLRLPGLIPKVSIFCTDINEVIDALTDYRFDAAIIFTEPQQSPYSLAYFAYLAGIPVRVGQSCEFGGSLLSQAVQPPIESSSSTAYHRHLLRSVGLLNPTSHSLSSPPAL
jgi:hypothetical protein